MTYNVSHAQGEQLAQLRPAVTTPVTLFTAQELRVEVTLLIICNHAGGAVQVNVYHDDDGTTYDSSTMLVDRNVAQDDIETYFQAQHPGSGIHIKPGGSIGVQVASANDVTFTLYGVTETLAERVRGTT